MPSCSGDWGVPQRRGRSTHASRRWDSETSFERETIMATHVQSKSNKMKRPPPGEPWSPQVDVILDPANKKFHFESEDIEIGTDNYISFHNDGQPGFVIAFHLRDPRHGFRFPEDLKAALWAVDEPACPEEERHWGQFKAKA